jgi:hypothetical protein
VTDSKPTRRTITEAEYTGDWISADDINGCNGNGDADGYFYDIESLVEHCLETEQDLPTEVHGCTPVLLDVRGEAERLVERVLEDAEIGDGDITVEPAKVAELQALIDAWAATVKTNWVEDDPSTVIVIDDATRADFDRRRSQLDGGPVDVDAARLDGEASGAEEGGAS